MKYELKKIGVWSFAKLAFVVNLVAGFLFGIAYAVFMIPMMAIMANMPGMRGSGFDMEMAPVGLILIIMPIMSAIGSAVFGTLGGTVMVFVYNLAARGLGGLEMTLEPASEAPTVATPPPHHPPPPETPPPVAPDPPPPSTEA